MLKIRLIGCVLAEYVLKANGRTSRASLQNYANLHFDASSQTEKIDYKEVLGSEEFERFTVLRKRRKKIADKESIPAFAVFTDKELAEMAKIEDLTVEGMLKIDGINKGCSQRFGKAMLSDEYPPKEELAEVQTVQEGEAK